MCGFKTSSLKKTVVTMTSKVFTTPKSLILIFAVTTCPYRNSCRLRRIKVDDASQYRVYAEYLIHFQKEYLITQAFISDHRNFELMQVSTYYSKYFLLFLMMINLSVVVVLLNQHMEGL